MRRNSRCLGHIYQKMGNIFMNYDNLKRASSDRLKKELEKHNSSFTNLKIMQKFIEELYYLSLPEDEIQLNVNYYCVYSADLFLYLLVKEAFLKGIKYVTPYECRDHSDDYIYDLIDPNKFNIISKATYNAEDYKKFIKGYAEKHKLHIIQNLKLTKEKTRAELVSRFHDNNYIVILYAGIAFDVKNRTLIYSKALADGTRSTVDLKQLIFLVYTSNDLSNISAEVNNNLRNETEKLFNSIERQFDWMSMFIIEETIIASKKDRLNNVISELNNQVETLEKRIKEELDKLNTKKCELFYLENKPIEYKVSELINRYKREKLIYKVEIKSDDNTLVIHWFAIPVTLFDTDKLERSLNNITNGDEDRKELLRKVINGEYTMFSAPFKTMINLTDLSFKTYKEGYYDEDHYNNHPLYYSNKGCRGTFEVPMYEAMVDGDLHKLLVLIRQFYQTITINDMLGNSFCRHSIIVDENNNIIDTDCNIYEYYNVYGELPKEEDDEY